MCITYGGDEHGNGQMSKPYCPWQKSGGYPQRGHSGSVSLQKVKRPIYYKSVDGKVSFYAAYGESNCGVYATEWCKKNCYMKTQPFKKSEDEEIQKIKLENYECETIKDLVDCIKDEKYVTFFASGCIENIGLNSSGFGKKGVIWYIHELAKQIASKEELKDTKIRFFLRDPDILTNNGTFIDEIYDINPNSTLILSIDRDNSSKYLNKGIMNYKINGIAFVRHPDNIELIDMLKDNDFERYLKQHNINKIIECKNCGENMLCFNQPGRFILIQEFKDAHDSIANV